MSPERVTRTDFAGAPVKVTRLESGAVRLEAAVTRTGVLQYSDGDRTWGELHLPEEVHAPESLATLPGLALTEDHPEDLVTPDTWDAVAVGHVADAVRVEDGTGLVLVDAVVSSAGTLGRIDAGELVECSAGYTCALDPTPGEFEGERFDAVQRNIRYNHLALGPEGWGRAGSDVRLRLNGGAREVRPPPRSPKDHTMADKNTTRRTDADPPAKTEEPVMDEGALRLQAMEKMYSDALKENARLNAELEAMKGQKPEVKEEDVPPAVQDSIASKRASLLAGARAVLGADAKLDGLSAAEIHRKVIAARHPDVKMDGLSADFVAGRAQGIMDAARASADATARADNLRGAHPGPVGTDRTDANDLDLSDLSPLDALNALTATAFERGHARAGAAQE